jgi:RNA 2',3'-cyclic 3'-phosphodiesterase
MLKKRCFISVDFNEEVKNQISKIQEKLPEFVGKKTELQNIHLTLKFLGEIEEEKINQIKEKLKEIKLKSFFAEINSIGVFSEKFVRIIWLNINNCDFLQKKIDETLRDIFDKEERFQGHITIARVKKIKDKKKFLEELKKIYFQKIRFKVNRFYLKESVLTGKCALYNNIEIFELF